MDGRRTRCNWPGTTTLALKLASVPTFFQRPALRRRLLCRSAQQTSQQRAHQTATATRRTARRAASRIHPRERVCGEHWQPARQHAGLIGLQPGVGPSSSTQRAAAGRCAPPARRTAAARVSWPGRAIHAQLDARRPRVRARGGGQAGGPQAADAEAPPAPQEEGAAGVRLLLPPLASGLPSRAAVPLLLLVLRWPVHSHTRITAPRLRWHAAQRHARAAAPGSVPVQPAHLRAGDMAGAWRCSCCCEPQPCTSRQQAWRHRGGANAPTRLAMPLLPPCCRSLTTSPAARWWRRPRSPPASRTPWRATAPTS